MVAVVARTVLELDASRNDRFYAGTRDNRARAFCTGARFHAGARFSRAGRDFTRAGDDRTGAFCAGAGSSFDARRFSPPPSLGNHLVNPLRDAFLNTIRVDGIALARSHIEKT